MLFRSENELMPPEPIGKNMYQMTKTQLSSLHIDKIPTTLGEACQAFEEDKFLQDILGEHVSAKYLEAKEREWKEYCSMVSQWELDEYLYKF